MSSPSNSSAPSARPAPVPAGLGSTPAPQPRTSGHAHRLNGWRGVARILAFFAFAILLIYGLHFAVNRGLRQITTSKYGAFNALVSGSANADILINGSSRALNHYDPRTLQAETGLRTYNLGMNASQSDVQLAVLRTYLKHNRAPKLLIHNLDLFSFEGTRKGELYNPALFVPYLGDDELFKPLVEIDSEVWKWKYIPLYGYTVPDMSFSWIFGLMGLAGVQPPEDYINGFNPRYGTWNEDFEHFRVTIKDGVTYRIEPRAVQALMKIVETSLAHGAQPVLVYSPEYHEMQALEINRAEIIALFEKIALHYKVTFLDYSASPISRDKTMFINSQHLNNVGAEAFSRLLSADLRAKNILR
jgi:hypothetical protein